MNQAGETILRLRSEHALIKAAAAELAVALQCHAPEDGEAGELDRGALDRYEVALKGLAAADPLELVIDLVTETLKAVEDQDFELAVKLRQVRQNAQHAQQRAVRLAAR